MHSVFWVNYAFESLPPWLLSTGLVVLNIVVEAEVGDAVVGLSRFYAFLEDLLAAIQHSEFGDIFVFITKFWEISQ